MKLFVDVLETQKKRNHAGDEMQRFTNLLNWGKISVQEYRKYHAEWLKTESDLRKKVTHIYDIGYEHGCFAYEVGVRQ